MSVSRPPLEPNMDAFIVGHHAQSLACLAVKG